MPKLLHRGRSVIFLACALLALAGLPARAASPYGVLDHFELCDGNGVNDYVSLRSIAVDPASNIYVAGNDNLVRVLSPGGIALGTLADGPLRPWESPVVANGPAGVVYIGDQGGPSTPAQLAKYTLSGGNLQLAQTYVTDQGSYATTTGIIDIAGLVATQNRGLFILDPTQGIVNLNDQTGAYKSLTFPGGKGRLVAMTAIPNAVVVASTNDDGTPDWTQYYAGDPLSYSGETNIGPFVDAVADGYDGSVWVLSSAGLQHYRIATLLDTLPVYGYALDTTSDGSVWVIRQDGILHIGPGGGTIPPDEYGHAPCGGPKITDSLPRQSIRATHQLEITAHCAEACALISSATLTVPGSRTTYKLIAPKAQYSSAGTFDLRLRFRGPGYNALIRALNHHRKGTILIKMGSIDAGYVRAYLQQRIIVS